MKFSPAWMKAVRGLEQSTERAFERQAKVGGRNAFEEERRAS
jgi:hypothetical protein